VTEKQCAQRGICRNPSAYNCTWGFHVPSGPSQTEEDEHEAVVCPGPSRAAGGRGGSGMATSQPVSATEPRMRDLAYFCGGIIGRYSCNLSKKFDK
jgi:hypothetical protein